MVEHTTVARPLHRFTGIYVLIVTLTLISISDARTLEQPTANRSYRSVTTASHILSARFHAPVTVVENGDSSVRTAAGGTGREAIVSRFQSAFGSFIDTFRSRMSIHMRSWPRSRPMCGRSGEILGHARSAIR